MENMSFNFKLVLGGFIVLAACCLTMSANYPRIYSPYSFSVVMPAIIFATDGMGVAIAYLLSSAPVLILYLIFSIFISRNKNVFSKTTYAERKPSYIVSKRTRIFAILLVLLSVCFNAIGFSTGLKYQGLLHTISMYAFNLLFISALVVAYIFNRNSPTPTNCLGFNILLFSWLGWVAFPWLGELI